MGRGLAELVGGLGTGFAASQRGLAQQRLAEEQLQQRKAQLAAQQQLAQQQLALGQQRQTLEEQKFGDLQKLHNAMIGLTNEQAKSWQLKTHISQMSEPQIRQKLVFNALAPLSQIPIAQRPSYYQNVIKSQLQQLKATSIPDEYTPQLGMMAQYGYNMSARGMQAQRLQNDLLKQQLQNMEKQREAAVKAAATPTPYVKAYSEAGAKADQAFATQIQQDSDQGIKLRGITRSMIGTAGQIPSEFGVIMGNQMNLTPRGLQLIKQANQFVLANFEGMKHIGRGGNLLLRIIRKSKPSPNMPYSTFQNVVRSYEALSQRAIEYNNFVNYMHEQGITDRNRLSSIWSHYTTAHPLSDDQGNPNMQNLGKWESFLDDNPHYLGRNVSRETRKETVDIPKGFKFPTMPQRTTTPDTIAQPQVVAQQPEAPALFGNLVATPEAIPAPIQPQQNAMASSPYMAPNPYDIGVTR